MSSNTTPMASIKPAVSDNSNENSAVKSFPFTDLPDEFRTRVYREVLRSETDADKSRQPPLSLTCKQVRQELKNICYGQKNMTITAAFLSFAHIRKGRWGTSPVYCHTTMTGDDVDHLHTEAPFIGSFSPVWPDRMLDAKNIVLNVYLDDSKPPGYADRSDFLPVNHLLSSLNTHLRKGKRVDQKLTIKFLTSGPPVSKILPPEIIYPIPKLPFGIGLEVFGLGEAMEDKINEWRFSPGNNYLQRDLVAEWASCRPRMYKQLETKTVAAPGSGAGDAGLLPRVFSKYDERVEHRAFQVDENSEKAMGEILDLTKASEGETSDDQFSDAITNDDRASTDGTNSDSAIVDSTKDDNTTHEDETQRVEARAYPSHLCKAWPIALVV